VLKFLRDVAEPYLRIFRRFIPMIHDGERRGAIGLVRDITDSRVRDRMITIKDATTGVSFTTQQTYAGPGTSAEWIEEAPSVGGRIAPLAHYSSPDTFDPGTANGGNPGLTVADGGVMIQRRAQVSTPSIPDADTDGFNMAYGNTVPAAPGS